MRTHRGRQSRRRVKGVAAEDKSPLKNGSFLSEKPRISGATPDFKKGAKRSGARCDLSGLYEALGNLGHQERPKATAEGTPEELPPELFALLERRMSTSSRSAYAAVHVPMPEHRVHRPGASR